MPTPIFGPAWLLNLCDLLKAPSTSVVCWSMNDPILLLVTALAVMGIIMAGLLFAILFQLHDTAKAATAAATAAASAVGQVAHLLAVTTPRTASSPPSIEPVP